MGGGIRKNEAAKLWTQDKGCKHEKENEAKAPARQKSGCTGMRGKKESGHLD
jgi:hypothetical protein